jgi:cellulose synthase/poly-beta-1,6-N-acetylglucosamine synthase-like glycosyltransferase
MSPPPFESLAAVRVADYEREQHLDLPESSRNLAIILLSFFSAFFRIQYLDKPAKKQRATADKLNIEENS